MAQDFGDLSATFAPVLIDDVLDEFDIIGVNSPISDGQGQHDQHITKKYVGRQLKMKKS
ncbi:MAG: hypothetical protein JRH18_19930, partial [Deltaproteobacteria bacterium]|nr:hypothetical protein [Deltaproteobacteria bacterium]MBW1962114.1 hypothetical protein [Deltaproteobacteria bacterium]MBW2153921.1 hypothetical protein [Deltaproteobacteria bacterium]